MKAFISTLFVCLAAASLPAAMYGSASDVDSTRTFHWPLASAWIVRFVPTSLTIGSFNSNNATCVFPVCGTTAQPVSGLPSMALATAN